MRKSILLCLILLLILSVTSQAIDVDKFIRDSKKVSSEELISKANYFMDVTNQPDSALLYYSLVSNRYNEDMLKNEKLTCIDALINKWYIYLLIYYDYDKAYENLLKAQEVAQKIDCDVPKIEMGFGCMFQVLAQQTNDKELFSKAFKHTHDAVESSFKTKDEEILNITFTNLMLLAHDMDSLKNIEPLYNRYENFDFKKDDVLIEYNKLLYKALDYYESGKYNDAKKCFDKQIELLKFSKENKRFLIMAYTIKTEIDLKTNNLSSARNTLGHIIKMSRSEEMKDARIDVYELYNKLYKKRGDYKNAELYRDSMYMVKDSLLNYQQITSINETGFLNEIKSIDIKLNELKLQNIFQKRLLIGGILTTLIILLFTFLLYMKNKELTKTNKELYNKNVMLLKSEDKEKEISRKLRDTNICTQTITTPGISSEEQKLLDNILKVMDDAETICSFNFTIEKLSFIINSKQRQVSEIIKKMYDCNFNTFISEYRIKEACRRFNDVKNFGAFTIEGVGNSVGFKSRSNFITTFKKITGLTPSQYKKMAEMQE